jgi:signal transduction histidine kinase
MNLTLQACRKMAESPALLRMLDSVQHDLISATDLLEELKSLNRRETYRLQRLDVITELKSLVEQLRATPSSPIIIDFLATDDKLIIAGDLSRLRRVWQNVIRNGMDAAETRRHGERPRMTVSIKKSGKFARLQFKDTAGGISKAKLARIFEPFYTTKGEKNRGLGLFIARKIVLEHHGKIRVASMKPHTRVTIDLPLIS